MEKIKKFFVDLWDNSVGLYKKAAELFRNDRRAFCVIATKASFGLLFWIGLMLPFYVGKALGITIAVNMFLMDIWYVYFFGIIALIFVYLVYALNLKKQTNKVFRIQTIVFIVMYLRFILSYILDSSDSLVTTTMGFGFILTTFSFVILLLLTWKESLILNIIFKVFKVPAEKVVEDAPQPEPVPEPEVVVEPAPAPEPAPVPKPESAPEPKDVEEVEEELEELVEEETKIEDAEQAIESFKEKE